jgi:hypothetical protein
MEEGYAMKLTISFAVEWLEYLLQLFSIVFEVSACKFMPFIFRKIVNHFSAFITSILNNSLDEIDENFFVLFVKLDHHTSIKQIDVNFVLFFSH